MAFLKRVQECLENPARLPLEIGRQPSLRMLIEIRSFDARSKTP